MYRWCFPVFGRFSPFLRNDVSFLTAPLELDHMPGASASEYSSQPIFLEVFILNLADCCQCSVVLFLRNLAQAFLFGV